MCMWHTEALANGGNAICAYVCISPELCVHTYTRICTCGRRLLLCLPSTCTVQIVQYACTCTVYACASKICTKRKGKRREGEERMDKEREVGGQ